MLEQALKTLKLLIPCFSQEVEYLRGSLHAAIGDDLIPQEFDTA